MHILFYIFSFFSFCLIFTGAINLIEVKDNYLIYFLLGAISLIVAIKFDGKRIEKIYREKRMTIEDDNNVKAKVKEPYIAPTFNENCTSDTCIVASTKKVLSSKKALKEFKNFVVLDFETTGFSCENDRPIEIACYKTINGVTSTYSSFINPNRKLSKKIIDITGIKDEDLSDAPDRVSVAKEVFDFIEDLPIVAHNATFDVGFLRKMYEKSEIQTNIIYVDTLALSRKAFPEFSTHKLAFLVTELGISKEQTHRALDDVMCTVKLLEICIDKLLEQK